MRSMFATTRASTRPVGDRSASTSTATRAPREPSGASPPSRPGWVKAAETVVVMGKPSKDDVEACWNLGATIAAQLME